MKETPINRENMYKWIISTLSKGGDMTAREVAQDLYENGYIPYPIRQATAPRLTELKIAGRVKVVDSKLDDESFKTVSIYSIA